MKINKTYQRLNGRDMITPPKTKQSNRTIQMPEFLCEEMKEFFGMQYGLKKKDRIFTINKSYLHREMDRGAKVAGVKRIRIHDLRHSHISLLIDMGFSAVAKIVSDGNREWEGSPTDLSEALQLNMAVNRLTKHLNVNASRLLEEYQVKYENKTKHAGRRIRLTYMVEAPMVEVIK